MGRTGKGANSRRDEKEKKIKGMKGKVVNLDGNTRRRKSYTRKKEGKIN